uniref:PRAME like 13 n=1 Tax=Jaculus jaculus TaxID=51337 RepID=A0A8C5KFY2_JACJA
MSPQASPTLLELAMQNLLRKEALAISALEDLPGELFPRLFKAAFVNRQTDILKAMVQVWPFPCLPLGALMKTKTSYMETLQVILDGLDLLLAEKTRPRRCKLQVLDLRSEHQNFWKVWAENTADICSAEAKSRKQAQQTRPGMGTKQPLQVFVDVHLTQRVLDPFFNIFVWAEERKGLLQLSCKRLKISTVTIQRATKALGLLDLGCVQEVEVQCTWKLATLAAFAPYLGQMKSLRRFFLSHVQVPVSISPEEKEQFVTQFASQFLNLSCLQELFLASASFLEGCLAQMLRCLKAPLDALSITDCQLLQSDLDDLSQCPSIHQLKHLNLSGVQLTHFSPDPLRVLLERVAATLQTLDLEGCRIEDSQLSALLPALCRCVQLTTFNYLKNSVSVEGLEHLLRHTARLSRLSLEMYSVPWEIYRVQGAGHRRRLEQLRDELRRTVVLLGHHKTIWFSIIPCPPY